MQHERVAGESLACVHTDGNHRAAGVGECYCEGGCGAEGRCDWRVGGLWGLFVRFVERVWRIVGKRSAAAPLFIAYVVVKTLNALTDTGFGGARGDCARMFRLCRCH